MESWKYHIADTIRTIRDPEYFFKHSSLSPEEKEKALDAWKREKKIDVFLTFGGFLLMLTVFLPVLFCERQKAALIGILIICFVIYFIFGFASHLNTSSVNRYLFSAYEADRKNGISVFTDELWKYGNYEKVKDIRYKFDIALQLETEGLTDKEKNKIAKTYLKWRRNKDLKTNGFLLIIFIFCVYLVTRL